MPTTPVRHVPLPSQAVKQPIAQLAVGDMSNNCIGASDSGDLVEDVAGPHERLVARPTPGSDVIERDEVGQASGYVKIQTADVTTQPAVTALPPNLSDRDGAGNPVFLDGFQPAAPHQDSPGAEGAERLFRILQISKFARDQHRSFQLFPRRGSISCSLRARATGRGPTRLFCATVRRCQVGKSGHRRADLAMLTARAFQRYHTNGGGDAPPRPNSCTSNAHGNRSSDR